MVRPLQGPRHIDETARCGQFVSKLAKTRGRHFGNRLGPVRGLGNAIVGAEQIIAPALEADAMTAQETLRRICR